MSFKGGSHGSSSLMVKPNGVKEEISLVTRWGPCQLSTPHFLFSECVSLTAEQADLGEVTMLLSVHTGVLTMAHVTWD